MNTPLKKSRQRDAVLKCVQRHHDHPTADIIFHEVQSELPHISLGTIYRNLSVLVQHGKIRKINMENAADRFDGNMTPHSHFICAGCGRVEDIPQALEPKIDLASLSDFEGRIGAYSVIFSGLCKDCITSGRQG